MTTYSITLTAIRPDQLKVEIAAQLPSVVDVGDAGGTVDATGLIRSNPTRAWATFSADLTTAQQQTLVNIVAAHVPAETATQKADALPLPTRVLAALAIINSTSVARNGTTTINQATVTGLAKTSDLTVGMVVGGTGIGTGAAIKSIDSASQVTLSVNSTASGTVSVGFACATPAQKATVQAWLDAQVINLMAALGI